MLPATAGRVKNELGSGFCTDTKQRFVTTGERAEVLKPNKKTKTRNQKPTPEVQEHKTKAGVREPGNISLKSTE